MVSPKELNKRYYRHDNDSDRGELPKASPRQAGSRNSGELQPASVAKLGVVGHHRSTLWALLGHYLGKPPRVTVRQPVRAQSQ
jgi:hypothetical protein